MFNLITRVLGDAHCLLGNASPPGIPDGGWTLGLLGLGLVVIWLLSRRFNKRR
jgi:hypothetical protein